MKTDLARLQTDFRYWAWNTCRIKPKEVAEGASEYTIPFRLNRCQRMAEDLTQRLKAEHPKNWLRLYVLKGRQGGYSTYEQLKNLWYIWKARGIDVITLADNAAKTGEIFQTTRRAIDNFPLELLPVLGLARTREVEFRERDSRFWTATAGSKTAGQSVTLTRLHGSEFAFWEDPLALLRTAQPALERRGTEIALETTASTYDSDAHGFWKEAQDESNGYHALFLPWWICEIGSEYSTPLLADDELGTLEPQEKFLVETHGLSLENINWRRDKIRTSGEAGFLNQYPEDPETCWLVAGDLFFDKDILKYLLDRAPEPIESEFVEWNGWSGRVDIYDTPNGEEVVMGSDTAEGGGGDSSTFVARSKKTWRLLAVFKSNTIEPKAFAWLLNKYGRRFGTAHQVVEKNAHGITILRDMRDEHHYPDSRIFHQMRYDEANKKPMPKIGWATTEQSKPALLDAARDLFRLAKDTGVYLSAEALRDAFNVVRDDKGKVSLNGKDVLVAEMLAWQGRTNAVSYSPSFTVTL